MSVTRPESAVVQTALRPLRNRREAINRELERLIPLVDGLKAEADEIDRLIAVIRGVDTPSAPPSVPIGRARARRADTATDAATPDPTGLVPVVDAAKRVGLHPETLRQRARKGELGGVRDADGRIRIDMNQVVAAYERSRNRNRLQTVADDKVRRVGEIGRELGVFTTPRLREYAATRGIALSPERTSRYAKMLVEAGVFRHYGGSRGPTSYYAHRDCEGEVNLAAARGGTPYVPPFKHAQRAALRAEAAEADPTPTPTSGGAESAAEGAEATALTTVQEKVRDFAVKHRRKFGPALVAAALRIDRTVAREAMEFWAERGTFRVVSAEGTDYICEWIKPDDPGSAAKLNGRAEPTPEAMAAATVTRGTPIAGTGAGKLSPDKEVQALADAVVRAGGSARKTGGGHIALTLPDGTPTTMSSTPGRSGMSHTKDFLRKNGIAV